MRCGLLGKKLGHSYSPQIHSHFDHYAYDLFEVAPEKLEDFLKHGDFTGINVTMPYKKDVIPYLDHLSDLAAELGAVNTIVRKTDGTLVGHNTDYYGFQFMLKRTGLQVGGKKVLVLGSGGASATVVSVLRSKAANVVIVSRNGNDHYGNLEKHSDAAVIVNTTPVGMYPNTGVSAVDLSYFPHLEGVLDVIYNPAKTQLILDAEKRGLITENGLWMLVAQAKESAEWFLNRKIEDAQIIQIHNALRRKMGNIVLIGMPGSGKTTIGQSLATRLNRRFVDSDSEIVARAGMSIPQIFEKYGEDEFRRLETQVLCHLGKESGLVIATGGGCVTRQANYPCLHQNGRIYWIKREIDMLPTNGRPLSRSTKLDDMYCIRKPLYESFADYTVENTGSVDNAVSEILNQEVSYETIGDQWT